MSMVDGTWDFFVQGITVGDTVTLNANRGSNGLPESVTCMLFTAGSDVPDQMFTMNLSSDDELYLQDTFGSFQLEACDVMDCMIEVTYAYTVVNTGQTDATVTTFTRERDDEILDLLAAGMLDPVIIAPGSTGSAEEKELVNYCKDAVYFTKVDVDAVPPTGLSCPATANYEFAISVGCRVDVDIICTNEFGVACDAIETPEGTCGLEGSIEVLRFKYSPSTCADSVNTHTQPIACEDLLPIPDNASVVIECTSADGVALSTEPTPVSPDSFVTITTTSADAPALPAAVLCWVKDSAGEGVYQEFSFYTTNGDDGNSLRVKDQFGSLELVSCINAAGNGPDCIQVVQYSYQITNVGVNDMALEDLERTRNNVTETLTSILDTTNLKPGEVTQAYESAFIDVCEAATFDTYVAVNADPENGISCFDEDQYTFEITPPCSIDAEMTCTTVDGGFDCASTLVGEEFVECRCADDCATELIYRYTAASCVGSQASECTDLAENSASSAEIVFQSEGTTLFSGTVQEGENFAITNSMECLPSEFQVTVSASDQTSQEVTIDASCGTGQVTLLENFGAFEFAGYTCADAIPHNCYIDVEYEVVTTGTGTVGQNITEWAFTLNDDTVPASVPLPSIGAQEQFSETIPSEIELCVDGQYIAGTVVTAVGDADGQPCSDTDTYTFNIVVGTPFPTTSPSSAPSASPSASPSVSPSTGPSVTPSSPPSASPSVAPSDFPSLVPSTSPSASPSSSPSASPSASPSSSPSASPSAAPSASPSASPSAAPSDMPSDCPSIIPSASPSASPSSSPSASPRACSIWVRRS